MAGPLNYSHSLPSFALFSGYLPVFGGAPFYRARECSQATGFAVFRVQLKPALPEPEFTSLV